jgi:vacuolar-type H+-ATPase catalytic subunit A/Vma1
MTAYSEAVREVASRVARSPAGGLSGYLYSGLASLYERAGRIKRLQGIASSDLRVAGIAGCWRELPAFSCGMCAPALNLIGN